jgi:hypothetical protein
MFRGKFLAGLRQLRAQNALRFAGNSAALAGEQGWIAWLQDLRTKDWVIYAKPPFGGPERVLKYLSRYTHRTAIANHRLVAIEDGVVRFRWRDYAHHNQVKVMALPAEEFLRRFLLHVVPSGFMRIRHFGLLANRHRAAKLARCRTLLAPTPKVELDSCSGTPCGEGSGSAPELKRCPLCGGGPVRIIEILAPVRGVPP